MFHTRHFFELTFVANIGWSLIYLMWGNVLWLGLSHALLGAAYCSLNVKKNMIKDRIRILKASGGT